jgi:hypothetical protein
MNRSLLTLSLRGALLVLVLLGVVVALGVRSSLAGVTFATAQGTGESGLKLTIDSTTHYNGVLMPRLSWHLKNLTPGVDRFFNFDDVKPGDSGTSSISLHIDVNPAYVCLDFVNFAEAENGINEPESFVDTSTSTGELGDGLEFFAWLDDGDQRFEVGEVPLFGTSSQSANVLLHDTTYVLADATFGVPFAPGSVHYVGLYWCAGNLEINLATAKATCDGTVLGNEAQTDSLTLDVVIRAVEARTNPGFRCVPIPDPCSEIPKGNNGHGNDDDGNDDSNPGNSNDPDDDTDDDGLPPGFVKRLNGVATSTNPADCKLPKGNNGHGNDDDRNDNSNPGNSNDPDDDTDDDGLPPGFAKKTATTSAPVPRWEIVPVEAPKVTGQLKKLLRSLGL